MQVGDEVVIRDLPESILGGREGIIVEEAENSFYDWWVRIDEWITTLAFRENELEAK